MSRLIASGTTRRGDVVDNLQNSEGHSFRSVASDVRHLHPGLVANPIRFGILCLPISAALFVIGAIVRGPFYNPEFASNTRWFAQSVVSRAYSAGWLILLAAMTLLIFGVLSLGMDLAHGRGRARALLGVCLSVAGLAVSLAVAGSFVFGWPSLGEHILSGDPAAVTVAMASYNSTPLRIAGVVGSALYIAGSLPIAMVIWESRALPRWAGLLYLIHAPLLCIAATTTLAFEHLGAFFLLLAGIALSWGVRHEEEVVRHLEHHTLQESRSLR
ncbi:MAG TPA: DUF4386 family protein [Myxococcales bacterium]|nr:DUF4386 family protein [Myxococcales bacterium]